MKGLVALAAERLDRTVIAQELLPGGYTPQRLVRLRLAGGGSAVLKAAPPAAHGDLMDWTVVLRGEAYRYRTLDMLRTWQPTVLDEFESEGWFGILLEDLGGARTLPPWDVAAVEAVARQLAAMHSVTVGGARPREASEIRWPDCFALISEAGRHRGKLPEAWDRPDFWDWLSRLARAAPAALAKLEETVRCVAHIDVRSDNLFLRGDRLTLIDWAVAGWDSPAIDSVQWVITAEDEGAGRAEELHRLYAREARWLTPEAVQGVLALLAGLFIHRLQAAEATPRHWALWPRLLKPTLRWIAAELELPLPPIPL